VPPLNQGKVPAYLLGCSNVSNKEGADVCVRRHPSTEPPQNGRDLAHHFSIDPVPELQCAERSTRVTMNGEIVPMQSAMTAQITTIPLEDEADRLLANAVCCGFRGLLDPSVDGDKCSLDQ
jgi:hypothetical protein